jgi:hypothetical protein
MQNGAESLSKVISMKADKDDLERLNTMKANKEETENMMDMIVTLNRQLQHTIVLLNESLKLNLIKANDTRQAKENRSQQLMSQVLALSSWALKFDAKSLINPAEKRGSAVDGM